MLPIFSPRKCSAGPTFPDLLLQLEATQRVTQTPFAQVSCFCWRSPRQETWVPVEQLGEFGLWALRT